MTLLERPATDRHPDAPADARVRAASSAPGSAPDRWRRRPGMVRNLAGALLAGVSGSVLVTLLTGHVRPVRLRRGRLRALRRHLRRAGVADRGPAGRQGRGHDRAHGLDRRPRPRCPGHRHLLHPGPGLGSPDPPEHLHPGPVERRPDRPAHEGWHRARHRRHAVDDRHRRGAHRARRPGGRRLPRHDPQPPVAHVPHHGRGHVRAAEHPGRPVHLRPVDHHPRQPAQRPGRRPGAQRDDAALHDPGLGPGPAAGARQPPRGVGRARRPGLEE